MCLSFVLRGRQCCASVVAKARLVGGGVRARVFRRDLREYPGAHYEMCARPRSGAIFGHIHACDIRCLRSAVLQPPGRTPAMVARGTRAFCLVWAMPCAPWFVLRVAARRRSLSYALPVAPQDFVLRVAALPQKWIARVAARAFWCDRRRSARNSSSGGWSPGSWSAQRALSACVGPRRGCSSATHRRMLVTAMPRLQHLA